MLGNDKASLRYDIIDMQISMWLTMAISDQNLATFHLK